VYSAVMPTSPLIKAAPWVFLGLWCGGFTVAKIGFTGAEPFTLLAIRYGAVVLLLLPFLVYLRPALPSRLSQWLHLAWVGFLIQVVYFGAAWVALNQGASAATVALITSLQPILVALAVPYLANEQVTAARWLGLGLGFLGCIWVIVANNEIDSVGVEVLGFAVLALLGMSVATIWEKRFGSSHHAVVSNLVHYSVGFACTLPIAWFTESMVVEVSSEFLFAISYLVVGNSILAISLLLMMIREGEVTRVTALFFLVPPGTALIAMIVLDEPMAPMAWMGMFVAVAGVWLVGRSGVKNT